MTLATELVQCTAEKICERGNALVSYFSALHRADRISKLEGATVPAWALHGQSTGETIYWEAPFFLDS